MLYGSWARELHLSILIETMRREGYELAVSKPHVIFKEINGEKQEPLEQVTIDVTQEFAGVVIEGLGQRKGELQSMMPRGEDRVRLEFIVPMRGLVGYASQFATETKGTGILNQNYAGYGPTADRYRRERVVVCGMGRRRGYLLCYQQYSGSRHPVCWHRERVYEGMIVGENSRPGDIDVNIAKKTRDQHAVGPSDIAIKLNEPRIITLEQAYLYC